MAHNEGALALPSLRFDNSPLASGGYTNASNQPHLTIWNVGAGT
jgi:hypothetical protein